MRWRVVILCLALGLTTTVLIVVLGAWSEFPSFGSRREIVGMYRAGAEGRVVTATVARGFGSTSIFSQATWVRRLRPDRLENWYESVERLPVPPWAELADDSVVSVSTTAHGWPLLCLSSAQRWRIDPATGLARQEWSGYITRGPTGAPAAPIPIRPIWSGLIANVLIWSIAWWVLMLAMVGATRPLVRYRRRSRGRCAGCGYDLSGLHAGASCPECGRSRKEARCEPESR